MYARYTNNNTNIHNLLYCMETIFLNYVTLNYFQTIYKYCNYVHFFVRLFLFFFWYKKSVCAHSAEALVNRNSIISNNQSRNTHFAVIRCCFWLSVKLAVRAAAIS